MEAAKLQESLSILIQLCNAMMPQHSWPGLTVCTHPSMEVPKEVDVLGWWDPVDGGIKLVVELFFDFGCSKQDWRTDAHKVHKAYRCGEAQNEDLLGAAS